MCVSNSKTYESVFIEKRLKTGLAIESENSADVKEYRKK